MIHQSKITDGAYLYVKHRVVPFKQYTVSVMNGRAVDFSRQQCPIVPLLSIEDSNKEELLQMSKYEAEQLRTILTKFIDGEFDGMLKTQTSTK